MSKKMLLQAALMAALAATGQANSQDHVQKDPSSGASPDPGAAAGRALFDGAGGCRSCHRVGAKGSVLGPNLSNVGTRLTPEAMTRQLTEPSATTDPKNQLVEVALVDGKSVQGKLVNQDPFSLQLLSVNGELVAYQRSQVRDIRGVDPPRMPSFKGKLTDEQINNLVTYLATLRVPGD